MSAVLSVIGAQDEVLKASALQLLSGFSLCCTKLLAVKLLPGTAPLTWFPDLDTAICLHACVNVGGNHRVPFGCAAGT